MSKRKNLKRRQTSGRFLSIPHHVLMHDDFASLAPRAVKLMVDCAMQYNGKNNGDLCITLSVMRRRNWNSNDQLNKAKKELIDKGFLYLTRQGGRKLPNLYAITWRAIDECNGKLDVSPTSTPIRKFSLEK